MSKFSVRKPFTIFVMVIVIIIMGVMSFTKMTADLLPSINLPYMLVTTVYAGASSEKVEKNVTIPLEKALATTSNVKTVSSISNENVSIIILEFTDNTNMDSALIDITNKVNIVKGQWSDTRIAAPNISKINPNMLPVMMAAVDVEGMELAELSTFVNEDIVPELQKVAGVASISATGTIEETINIKLSQEKIDNLNDKILNNIDNELAKTENELRSAKSEIENGRNELTAQSNAKKQQLTSGLTQIGNGKSQISNALIELNDKESKLNRVSNILSFAISAVDNAQSALENIKDTDKGSIIKAIEETVKNAIDEVKKILPDINIDSNLNLKDKLVNLYNEISAGLSQIVEARSELNKQKTSLETQEMELQNAQSMLNNEVNKAYSQLDENEAKIDQGIAGLADAKETAYKNASLEGVITQSMISNILSAENFSMPAGYIESESENLTVKIGEEFTSLDEINNLLLMHLDIEEVGDVVLQDVADISIDDNSDETYAKINGNDGIILSIQKQSTEATGTVSDSINEKFSELEKEYDNLHFTALMDQGMYIDMVINSVLQNLLYGAILAIIVLLIFLRDVKPTIAIALSIPVSLTFAIALMYFTGVSINIISLSGLALSVGMLVDNAIVVIENIYRLKNEGMPIKEAAIKGASSVAGAIFASTLTTICVFLPIIFVEGLTRELFTDMALTIAYALLASLLVALTVIPALTSKLFSDKKDRTKKKPSKILSVYENVLKWALGHKVITLASVLVLFVGSIALVGTMGIAFIPEVEATQMSLTVNFNPDISETDGNNIANEITNRLLEIPDIKTVGAVRASTSLSTENENSVSMYLILDENRQLGNVEMEKAILEKTDDLECKVEVSTSNMDLSALGGSGIEVVIEGDDLTKLQDIAKDLEQLFKNIDGVSDVDNGISSKMEEMKITINKNKAMEYGLTVAEIYSTLSDKLSVENEATTVNIDNKEYPVVVIKSDKDKLTADNLGNFEFTNKNDENDKVTISEIADIHKQNTMDSISRKDSERYITVNIQIDADHNIGLVSRDIENVIRDYEVPAGYDITLEGESETINQALGDLMLMILLAVAFIYLIMVAQFQSLKLPFIIMFTIPLAFTGGLIALFITGKELSVIAMLGFLILSGIVVNNGIVLIDYINQLRAQGKAKLDSIIEVGKTRMRPILMTAMTTILGMLTMAFGLGMGADMIQPLGIVVIGGMIYATILTLIVVPCMYDIIVKEKK